MKKLVFTLALMLGIMAVNASQLSVRMFNNAAVFIVLDGHQNSGLTNQHTFFNVYPGKHFLKVYAPTPYGRRGHLLFSGYFHIAPDVKLKAMIDRFHSFVVLETKYLQPKYQPHPSHKKQPDWEENFPEQYPKYDYNRHENRYIMNSRDFDILMNTIYSTAFDNSRMTIAKSALRNNYVSCNQLLQIINAFTFESNKVEIAKTGWHSVVDPQQFYVIFSAFSFKSSINEVDDYIRTH